MRSWLLAIAAVIVVAAACDQVPLTSPTGSTITLATNTNIVPVNGFAEITATVIESAGTAVHNGTEVTFMADFGRLDPPVAQTAGGRATTRFYADGRSGTVKINAQSGAASTGSGNSSSGGITLLVGGAAAARLTLRADPPTVPQTGGTVQVIAHVSDTNGNSLQGAPVSFSSNASASGAGTISPSSVVTDASGNAATTLTTRQTVTVTASVDTASASSLATATVTVAALTAPTVTLTCPPATQSAGVAVTCTIAATSPGGSPILNVTINWGDGSGEIALGAVSGTSTVSHTYASPGTYTVVASATDLNSQRGTAVASVTVVRVLPNITLTVPTSGTVGVPVPMSIAPATGQSQPITGVVVSFGDGTSRTFGSLTAAQGFTKTYASEGGYTVTATATDANGQQGTTSQAIVISRGSGPTVTLTSSSGPPFDRNQPETFTVGVAAGGAPIRSVVVTMTDGTVLYSGSSGGTFVYTFLGSGNTVLTAVVTDAGGNEGRTQMAVFINP